MLSGLHASVRSCTNNFSEYPILTRENFKEYGYIAPNNMHNESPSGGLIPCYNYGNCQMESNTYVATHFIACRNMKHNEYAR